MPVLLGPLRGSQWIKGSSDNGCWIGTYERSKQKVFAGHVRTGDVVLDIGAHVGFYSLLAARLVGESGRVFAFEPFEANVAYLKRHIQVNHLENIEVMEYAVSDADGDVFMEEGATSTSGRIASSGSRSIRSVTLDSLSASGSIADPHMIKMDIEGGEYAALRGGEGLLRRCHPLILLATHGAEVHGQCCRFLESLGYRLSSLDARPVAETDELLAS